MKLNQTLKLSFSDLEFYEKSHRYVLDNKDIPSVTGFIEEYYPEFKEKIILPAYATKHNRTEEDVKAEWTEIKETALERGNDGHYYGENREIEEYKTTDYRMAIKQFWDDLHPKYVEVARELRMYSRKYWRAGTTDFLLENQETGKLVVGDYKTNKDLFKSHGYMYYPFDEYYHEPISHYYIQLSFYQMMLEEAGYEIEDRIIVWTNRTKYSLYSIHKTPYLKTEIQLCHN